MAKLKLKKPNLKIKKPTKAGIKSTIVSTKFLVSLLVILALGSFGYSGYSWYNNTFIDKEDIFYGMLDKSLNTTSVLRTIEQDGDGKTEKQSVYLSFSPGFALHTQSRLEQITQDRERSSVSTETYGTKESDFVRYTEINVPKSEGDNTDYTKVLNTWAKRTNNDPSANNQSQFLDEAAFTFVPFGNFSDAKRAELVGKLREKKVYQLSGSKITYENGRPVYTGLASINPRGFVEVMRDYTAATGVGNLDQLDPSQYEDKNSFTIQVKIDVISRHLTLIQFPNGERTENYDAYGLTKKLDIPSQYISTEELQSRLQQN